METKILNRIKQRLLRKGITISMTQLRELKTIELTEDNFEEWYQTVLNYLLGNAPTRLQSQELENDSHMPDNDSNVDSDDSDEYVYYSEDVLKHILDKTGQEFNHQQIEEILENIQESFSNLDDCVATVYEAVKSKIQQQSQTVKTILEDVEEDLEIANNQSDNAIATIEEKLRFYEQKNKNLYELYSNLQVTHNDLRKIKNLLLGSLAACGLLFLGMSPLIFRFNTESYTQYLGSDCGTSLSYRICKMENQNKR